MEGNEEEALKVFAIQDFYTTCLYFNAANKSTCFDNTLRSLACVEADQVDQIPA